MSAWLSEVVPGSGVGELVTLECDEFPCIGFFQLPGDTSASSSVLVPLIRAFGDRTGGMAHVSVFGTSTGAWAGLAFAPTGWADDPEVVKRLQTRQEDLAEVYTSPE